MAETLEIGGTTFTIDPACPPDKIYFVERARANDPPEDVVTFWSPTEQEGIRVNIKRSGVFLVIKQAKESAEQ